jgi:hypothetical protein
LRGEFFAKEIHTKALRHKESIKIIKKRNFFREEGKNYEKTHGFGRVEGELHSCCLVGIDIDFI